MPPAPRRRRATLVSVPMAALVATLLIAVTLWGLAFWSLGRTAGQAFTAPAVQADVGACSSALLAPGCTVTFTGPDGVVRSRSLDRPGLLGTSTGETVPLWVAPDGSVGVAGWRAWADSALLVVLAVAMSGSAVRWFGTTLRQGDALTVFDLDDEEGRGRARDVG